MMSNVIRAIETSYGSLERPNWSFVTKRIKEGLYDHLVKKLAEVGSIQETTDENDDCSRCLFITSGTESLTLRLSLVDKYACVHDAMGRFFSGSDLLISLMGQRLSQLLKASDIQLVDEEALRTEVEFGGEKHTLYNLLFSIDGLI